MDQNQNQNAVFDFENIKKNLERDIAFELIAAVRDKKLEEFNLKSTAKEILNEFRKITSKDQLNSFLKIIVQKWPFLSSISIKAKFDNQTEKEKEVINKLSNYIKGFN